MRRVVFCTMVGLLLVAMPAVAGDFDGSKPLQCFVGEVQECEPARDCARFTPEEVGLPELIRVDFQTKTLSGTRADGSATKSTIRSVIREDGRISLQGHENGRSFSIVIDTTTGSLTATAGEPGAAFVLFGRCLAL